MNAANEKRRPVQTSGGVDLCAGCADERRVAGRCVVAPPRAGQTRTVDAIPSRDVVALSVASSTGVRSMTMRRRSKRVRLAISADMADVLNGDVGSMSDTRLKDAARSFRTMGMLCAQHRLLRTAAARRRAKEP